MPDYSFFELLICVFFEKDKFNNFMNINSALNIIFAKNRNLEKNHTSVFILLPVPEHSVFCRESAFGSD